MLYIHTPNVTFTEEFTVIFHLRIAHQKHQRPWWTIPIEIFFALRLYSYQFGLLGVFHGRNFVKYYLYNSRGCLRGRSGCACDISGVIVIETLRGDGITLWPRARTSLASAPLLALRNGDFFYFDYTRATHMSLECTWTRRSSEALGYKGLPSCCRRYIYVSGICDTLAWWRARGQYKGRRGGHLVWERSHRTGKTANAQTQKSSQFSASIQFRSLNAVSMRKSLAACRVTVGAYR